MSVVTRFASDIFNALPDRINLFGRYMTGFGGDGLQLDKSTERSLVAGTEKPPTITITVPDVDMEKHVQLLQKAKDHTERLKLNQNPPLTGTFSERTIPTYGPGLPASGPVNAYRMGSADKAVTQTLGRYNAEVTPDTVRLRDTYDMINEYEDPDLVSGKFQPKKAINNLIGTFRNDKQFEQTTGNLVDINDVSGGYNAADKNKMQDEDPTGSKATQLARSLMYLLPVKPKAYEIDYTIQR